MAESQAADLQTPESNTISPELALELRIRQLNALLTGQPTLSSTRDAQPVLYQLAALEGRLSELSHQSDGVRHFVDSYDLNAPLLSLQQAQAHEAQPREPDWLTKAILVLEQESDMYALEKDLREISVLVEQRSADQPGKMEMSKALQAPLDQLKDKINERAKAMDQLEDQATQLLGAYNSYVNVLDVWPTRSLAACSRVCLLFVFINSGQRRV